LEEEKPEADTEVEEEIKLDFDEKESTDDKPEEELQEIPLE
jgi:hypothetical protein